MAATGVPDGEPMLAALIARDRDGVGQHIDMALYDCQLAMLANVGSAALVAGADPPRFGNSHQTVVPYQLFAAADGALVVAVGNDRQFDGLCDLLGLPGLAADPRFATNQARVRNRLELLALIEPPIAARTVADWLGALRGAGIPCGEVRGVGAALAAPEAWAREMVVEVAHPTAGQVPLIASPLKLSETPVAAPVAPPLLGEHSDEVLRDLLCLAPERIMTLRQAGVVF